MVDGDTAWWDWRLRPRHRRGRPRALTPQVPGPAAADETAQAIYARMMKDTVAPALRELGFTGSGSRFELKQDPHTWRLLGFQKSAYSDRAEVRFTVNLCVIRKETWAKHMPRGPAKPSPSAIYGLWQRQVRIGELLPEPGDTWWRVMPGQDIDLLTANVLAEIRDYALAWLRQDGGGASLR